jgi:AmmeMemoRadiSam system protein A
MIVMPEALPRLSEEDQAILLDLARRAIAAGLRGEAAPVLDDPPARLRHEQGAFVSLHRGRSLRGCVGMVSPGRPLAETVASCALAAATQDPRFEAIAPSDLAALSIEISALDPLVRVRGPSEVTVGLHGLMVSAGGKRGVLLPQVAVQQGWDAVTFLEETCRKAGLPGHAWRERAVVEAFTAQVFEEGPPTSQ